MLKELQSLGLDVELVEEKVAEQVDGQDDSSEDPNLDAQKLGQQSTSGAAAGA
jgi:hypothetical protein